MTNTRQGRMTAAEIEREDRATWAAWRAAQENLWQEAGQTHWWDYRALLRARNRGVTPPADPYVGPYFIVEPYLREEARQWFDPHGGNMPRYTLAEWRRRRAEERAAEEEAAREGEARASLDSLALWADLNARRGALIRAARDAGYSWAEVAAASGLSRQSADALMRAHDMAAERAEVVASAEAVPVGTYDDGEPF